MNVVVYPAHVSVFVWVWHWSGHQSISMRYPRVFPRWDFQHCVSLRHENPPCYSPTDQQGGISWIWVDSSKSTIDFGENSRAPRDPHPLRTFVLFYSSKILWFRDCSPSTDIFESPSPPNLKRGGTRGCRLVGCLAGVNNVWDFDQNRGILTKIKIMGFWPKSARSQRG